jgi:hypothetical protein
VCRRRGDQRARSRLHGDHKAVLRLTLPGFMPPRALLTPRALLNVAGGAVTTMDAAEAAANPLPRPQPAGSPGHIRGFVCRCAFGRRRQLACCDRNATNPCASRSTGGSHGACASKLWCSIKNQISTTIAVSRKFMPQLLVGERTASEGRGVPLVRVHKLTTVENGMLPTGIARVTLNLSRIRSAGLRRTRQTSLAGHATHQAAGMAAQ